MTNNISLLAFSLMRSAALSKALPLEQVSEVSKATSTLPFHGGCYEVGIRGGRKQYDSMLPGFSLLSALNGCRDQYKWQKFPVVAAGAVSCPPSPPLLPQPAFPAVQPVRQRGSKEWEMCGDSSGAVKQEGDEDIPPLDRVHGLSLTGKMSPEFCVKIKS
eukprot:superscaffoldBa00000081_g1226